MAVVPSIEKNLNIESVTWGKLTWLNIERPTRVEVDWLGKNYPFHPLDLDDCLSRIQRPKIDEYENYLFIVVHFPVFNKLARVTMPSQVSIFIGGDYLITLHAGNLKPLVRLFRDCQNNEQVRRDTLGRSSGYLLYLILDRLVGYCFPILNKINSNIEDAEDTVFSKPLDESVVREISIIRRDIIAYRRIMHPQIEVVGALEKMERPMLKENMEVYFGDIADHIDKIWDGLEDAKEMVDGLSDMTNWLVSHRINSVMRLLTIVSTIMLPLIVVSGLWSMNIPLPWGHNPGGSPVFFYVILATNITIVAGMLLLFRLKRWI